jgi:hypothetical protein
MNNPDHVSQTHLLLVPKLLVRYGARSRRLTACNMPTAMFKLVGCPLMMINLSPGLTTPPGVAGVPGSVTRT